MNKINSQVDLDNFIACLDWADAFVRECYLESPTYVSSKTGGVVAVDAAPALKMLICTQDRDSPGVELVFTDLIRFSFTFGVDLEPLGFYKYDSICMSFSGHEYDMIECKSMYYKKIDTESWGHKVKYGQKILHDEGGLFDAEELNN